MEDQKEIMRITDIYKKNQKKRYWNETLYILAISIGGPNQRNQNICTGLIEGIKHKYKIKGIRTEMKLSYIISFNWRAQLQRIKL